MGGLFCSFISIKIYHVEMKYEFVDSKRFVKSLCFLIKIFHPLHSASIAEMKFIIVPIDAPK